MNAFDRRRFLKLGLKTMAGAGLALGANPLMTLARAADSTADIGAGYRALVCVYLEGGIDGFSLLVPTDNAEYNEYRTSRQNLSVDRGNLLDLTGANGGSLNIGLHSEAPELRQLFDEQRLAIIANVGNLIVPTTKELYENRQVPLPAQLFSHSDQEIQWQQLQGRDRAEEGWGALAANRFSSFQERDYLTSVTLGGSNYWQSGRGQRPYSMKETGLLEYAGMDQTSNYEAPRAEAFRNVAAQQYDHVFTSAYADIQNQAMRVTEELGAILESQNGIVTAQPDDNSLAAQLSMVAQLIAVHEQLGMRRQIFYVRMKGFDVHDHQSKNNPILFKELSSALSFFQANIDQLGQTNNVTTFTASDFGRTLTGNGDGTDHGWGNHLMVMGGAVRGGEIYGNMPRMSVDGPDAVRNGRIVPTLSSAQYASTLLNWMGLPEEDLNQILPTRNNFSHSSIDFLT